MIALIIGSVGYGKMSFRAKTAASVTPDWPGQAFPLYALYSGVMPATAARAN
jgi:hypothetical protein